MWLDIEPIKFFDNYLVWVYYSALLGLESQGDFSIYFDAFPEKRLQPKMNEIIGLKKLNTEDLSGRPLVLNPQEQIVEGHDVAAIGYRQNKKTILCVKSRKQKHATHYSKNWLIDKIGIKRFEELKANLAK